MKTEEVASCIEAKLYDPCDDAGGGFGRAQCAWAHAEVAERRMRAAEGELVSRLNVGKTKAVLSNYKKSQRLWRAYRDSYCRFTNETVDLEVFAGISSSYAGYCLRRLTEARAEELEALLRGTK